MRVGRVFVTVLVVLTLILFVQGARLLIGGEKQAALAPTPRIKGSSEAPLKIVEFLDYQCPSCAQASQTLNAYLRKYPDDIYVEARYFPLKAHQHAVKAASFAECASRQKRFWSYHDRLFQRQEEWRALADPEPVFWEIAREMNLDGDPLRSCLEDPATASHILRDKAEGDARGVRSTPTFFVNGEMIVGHAGLVKRLSSHFGGEEETN